MAAKKVVTKRNEITVFKEDGVWWAEIYDPEYSTRFTTSSEAGTFMLYVEQMLEVLDLTLDEVEWCPATSAAEKFLTKAQDSYTKTSS